MTLNHKLRAKGIGSSEIGMIIGVSPWGGQHKLWRRKTGREENKGSALMTRGQYVERAVLDWYEFEHCNGDTLTRSPGTKQHPDFPWVIDSVDAIRKGVCCVEAKTAHFSTHSHWDDGAPLHYAAQCQWHMGVWGLPYCDVPVDFGTEFKLFRVDFEPDTFAHMVAIAGRFWHDHVVADVEPELDLDADTGRWMGNGGRPQRSDKIRNATNDEVGLLMEYRDVLEALKRKDELEVKIKSAIGEDDGIRIDGTNAVATWRETKKGRRIFRTKKLLEETL